MIGLHWYDTMSDAGNYTLRILLYPAGFDFDLEKCVRESGLTPSAGCPNPGLYADIFAVFLSKFPTLKADFSTVPKENLSDAFAYLLTEYKQGNIDAATTCLYKFKERMGWGLQYTLQSVQEDPIGALATTDKLDQPFEYTKKFLSVFEPRLWFILVLFSVLLSVHSSVLDFARRRLSLRLHNSHRFVAAFCGFVFSLFAFDLYANGILTRLMVNGDRPYFTDTHSLTRAYDNGFVQLAMTPSEHRLIQSMADDTLFDSKRKSALDGLVTTLRDHPPVDSSGFLKSTRSERQRLLDEGMVVVDAYSTLSIHAAELCHSRLVSLGETELCYIAFAQTTPKWVVTEMDEVMKEYSSVVSSLVAKENSRVLARTRSCALRHGHEFDHDPDPSSLTTTMQIEEFWGVARMYALGLIVGLIVLLVECVIEMRKFRNQQARLRNSWMWSPAKMIVHQVRWFTDPFHSSQAPAGAVRKRSINQIGQLDAGCVQDQPFHNP